MRGADFRNEGVLNEKNIEIIFDKNKGILLDLLRMNSAEDFLFVFDEDSDGFLNEDEQILVFTVIKERIQIIAEELCSMQRYELYKDLMKEVRALEGLINTYQNELRQNLHKKQLDDYISIGYEMQNEFNFNWDKRVIHFDKKSGEDLKNLINELNKLNEMIYQQEANKIQSFNLKPLHQIEVLRNQEKLVAINERVEEATNFRNQLMRLKKKDKIRLEKKKNELIKKLNNRLDKDEKMEIKKKKDLIEKENHRLVISRNKETDILHKQINLHLKDIVRIQNSISNMFIEKGKKDDEIKRLKERQRNTNKVLASTKAVKTFSLPSLAMTNTKHDLALALLNIPSKNISIHSSLESTGISKFSSLNNKKITLIALRYIIKNFNIIRFDINSESNSRKFCNVNEDYVKNDSNLKKKIRKLLEQRKHKDETLIPPSYFYDNNLNILTDARNYRELLPKLSNSPR
jgi:hypothetical protein